MATVNSNLGIVKGKVIKDIDDRRWMADPWELNKGVNGVLEITAEVKSEGDHRVSRYLKSGVPVYKDGDVYKMFDAAAKAAGKKVDGFTLGVNEIQDRQFNFYEHVQTGVAVRGTIYKVWLPAFKPEKDDIPSRFVYIEPNGA